MSTEESERNEKSDLWMTLGYKILGEFYSILRDLNFLRSKVNKEKELEGLGRLQVNTTATKPKVRTDASWIGAKDEGEGGEKDARGQKDVLISTDEMESRIEAHSQGNDQTGEEQPDRLAKTKGWHKPPDGEQTQPGKEGYDGQDVSIGIGKKTANLTVE